MRPSVAFVQITPLDIEGAWTYRPTIHGDARGAFLEWFTERGLVDSAGHPLRLAQANCSVSAAGVLRGVHAAAVPPGQAKYVTCVAGAALDVVVDLRVGSPTFGRWQAVLLDEVDRAAVYLSEGLGHAFMALQDRTTVVYLCSEPYAPAREFGVHPLDPDLGIDWPQADAGGLPLTPVLSEKDSTAPGLTQARDAGLLPTLEECLAYRRRLTATRVEVHDHTTGPAEA